MYLVRRSGGMDGSCHDVFSVFRDRSSPLLAERLEKDPRDRRGLMRKKLSLTNPGFVCTMAAMLREELADDGI